MLNSNGFGKYETLTVIVMILIWCAMGGNLILKGANNRRYSTMRGSAASFARAVLTYNASLDNVGVVYLKEAIDEQILPSIKNPFGEGYCDVTQSKVSTSDGIVYTTLKCGDYLIDNAPFSDINEVMIIKVSDWSIKKIKNNNSEQKTMYNCVVNGKKLFNEYYEEQFFLYEYNKKFDTKYSSISKVKDNSCKIVSKTFYRTYEEIE